MFCNALCFNNSTNFNRQNCCQQNSCQSNYQTNCCQSWSRTNYGCGWYCCPNCLYTNCTNIANNLPVPLPKTANIGYFTNASATAIASQAVIPVNLAKQLGSSITSSGTGALLQPGVYKVTYSLTGTSTTTGTSTVGLQLNGTTQPLFSQSEQVATANNPYNLSASGLVTVTEPNSILNLINLGANAQNFSNVNLVVEKVA